MADRAPTRRELLDLIRRHDREFDQFQFQRRRTIDTLSELALALNSSKKKVRISKISGSAGGIIAAALGIAGLATMFIPPVGAGLAIAGSAVGVASGVVGGGATLGDILKSKEVCNNANRILREDNEAVENYQEMRQTLELGLRAFRGLSEIGSIVASSIQLIRFADVVLDSTGAAIRGASSAIDAIPIVGAVFNLVTLPLDIGTLISNSVDIHKGRPHQQAEKLNELVQRLEADLRELQINHNEEKEQLEELLLEDIEQRPRPMSRKEIAFYICITIILVCINLFLFFFSRDDLPPLLGHDVLMLPFD